MSKWNHEQHDFSGGQISPRMLMRTPLEVYRKSVMSMVNFVPTMQGSAQRSPGTRFIRDINTSLAFDWDYIGDSVANAAAGELVYDSVAGEIRIAYEDDGATDRAYFLARLADGDSFSFGTWTVTITAAPTDDAANSQYVYSVSLAGSAPATGVQTLTFDTGLEARIIPYLTDANERSLVLFTDSALKLVRNVTTETDPDNSSVDATNPTVTFKKNIVRNYNFTKGLANWVAEPEEYTGKNGDGPLGVFMDPNLNNTVRMVPRLYKYPSVEHEVCTLETTAEVDVSTDKLILDYRIAYLSNPSKGFGNYTFKITISSNSDYSTPEFEKTYTESDYPVGSVFQEITTSELLGGAGTFTGTIYIKLEATALTSAEREYSNPQFGVHYFKVKANGEAVLTEADLVTPYTADDLQDLHYVQSPYEDKELVITHPRHAPHRLRFNTGGGAYVFEPIPFTNSPAEWGVNNYPATCTSAGGRLVLAGGQTFKTDAGDPTATVSETVWATEVGQWTTFTAAPGTGADNESLQVNTLYRSPIQWAYGQKNLLVGALEMEYILSATDGILSPSNIGAAMHSTHGSNNVQPAGFGTGVLFPGDGGTKVRKMSYQDEQKGWVSQDLTLFAPEIVLPNVRRMVRLRNPHQMCVVVTGTGDVALFHSESGVEGWSRMSFAGGTVEDVCVVSDENGLDVPFFLVRRKINGVTKLYLEAIVGWRMNEQWDYVDCCLALDFDTPTDTITGLDHLEGKTVIVADEYRYIGFFEVTGGQVVLTDDIGGTTTVTSCRVGLQHRSVLTLLPPPKRDAAAPARFVKVGLRTLGSTRPIINGTRPADRDPRAVLNLSNPLDYVNDLSVTDKGWATNTFIEISEHLPFACEILGIHGEVKSSSL